LIVVTAGHVDHGKTSLVRSLTGTDTDRLPEEKKRGMSIDLGFAYLSVPDNYDAVSVGSDNTSRQVAFVDVPGHEKFVRNMIAGVSAVYYQDRSGRSAATGNCSRGSLSFT